MKEEGGEERIMNEIAQIISTIGFPIFSFILCGYALKYVYDRERKSLDETIDRLGELTLAVEQNSEALRQLVTELHGSKEVNMYEQQQFSNIHTVES